MKQEVQAVYQKGLLHPLQPLRLSENEQVAVTVHSGDEQWVDQDAHAWAAREGRGAAPLQAVREQLAKIGSSLAQAVIAERGEY